MSQTITLPVTGKLTIKQYNADGVLIDERNINNLVVNDGKDWLAQRAWGNGTIGGATGMMNYMAIGSVGGANTDVTQTALQNQVARVGATGSASSTGQLQFQATFGQNTPAGATGVLEAGIFNASSGGKMLARTVFSVINKGTSDTLAITWTITIGS